MSIRHFDSAVLQRFAAITLQPERMIQVGRHLSVCSICRVRLRRVQGGQEVLQRLHIEDSTALVGEEYEALFERLATKAFDRASTIEREKARTPALLQELNGLSFEDQRLTLGDDSRFHSAALVEALLESVRTEWSDDQARAERTAHLALEVADRLDAKIYGRSLANDLRARAWSFIGNARRIHSDLRGAEEAFQAAESVLEEAGSGDPLERARLLDLKASLRRAQRRFGDALALLDEAIEIYRKTRDRHLEGRTLISQAMIHGYAEAPEKAVPLLFKALEMIDRDEEPRLLYTIFNNLSFDLVALGQYDRASEFLPEAHRTAREFGTVDDCFRALWVEALLDSGHEDLAAAESKLRLVRDHFVQNGIGYNAALVSLDLAKVYLLQGRTEETKRLAAEMHPIFVSRDVQREAIAALLVFQQAAERENASLRLVEEVIRSVRRAQAGPQPRPERPA
jgi:tetratricopeptide (TPR) repeat protein